MLFFRKKKEVPKRPLGLYVHIPFCVRKCKYCDFLSAPADDRTKERYVQALCKEIREYQQFTKEYYIETIYFGGGTPSVLDVVLLEQILDAIKLIREIPGTTPSEACAIIIELVKSLDESRSRELEQFSLKYTSYVRAVVGAILETLGRSTDDVRRSINGVSSYKLPIPESVLPTKNNWNIYEPTRK